MNKVKLCNGLSIVLIVAFFINTILDYQKYSSTINSAPFRLWIYVNLICYIVPAFIVFIVSHGIKKKQESIVAEENKPNDSKHAG